MSVNVFFVGYGAPCPSMVFPTARLWEWSSMLRALARSIDWHNGPLAEINVESPVCAARSKTTIVRKPQRSKLFFNRHLSGAPVFSPKR